MVTVVGPNGATIPYQQGQASSLTFAVIPAGKTFHFGGETTMDGFITVGGVKADITTGRAELLAATGPAALATHSSRTSSPAREHPLCLIPDAVPPARIAAARPSVFGR